MQQSSDIRGAVATEPLPPVALTPAGAAKQVHCHHQYLVPVVNAELGHKRQARHITELQTASVQSLFGDVRLLLDLAGLQDSSLNETLKADTNLNAIQILAVRHVLCGSST
ncbi:TPA: hypothetical protein ACH3X1_002074 [Trebouxia sp. C0004]